MPGPASWGELDGKPWRRPKNRAMRSQRIRRLQQLHQTDSVAHTLKNIIIIIIRSKARLRQEPVFAFP